PGRRGRRDPRATPGPPGRRGRRDPRATPGPRDSPATTGRPDRRDRRAAPEPAPRWPRWRQATPTAPTAAPPSPTAAATSPTPATAPPGRKPRLLYPDDSGAVCVPAEYRGFRRRVVPHGHGTVLRRPLPRECDRHAA